MRKVVLLSLFAVLIGDVVFAQNDSTVTKSKHSFISGGYVHAKLERSRVSGLTSFNPVFGAAIILMNHIDLGFFSTWYDGDELVETIVFPNEFDMSYRYGGLIIGYHTMLEERYQLAIRVRAGRGEVLWERLDSGLNLVSDKMLIIEPQVSFGYVLNKFLAAEVYAGYRKMSDLDIPELKNEDFNGFQFGFGIKAGLVNSDK